MDERDEFEKWCRKNNGIPTRLKGTDQYLVPACQAAWKAWQARAYLLVPDDAWCDDCHSYVHRKDCPLPNV